MKSSAAIHDQNDSPRIGDWPFGSQLEYHQFKYNLLEDGDSIRLLLIRPAPRGEERLNGNMIHTTLSSSLGFTPLSYVWGTPAERRTVWVNEKQVLIGSNLYNALLHIRDEEKVVPVWADAIYIYVYRHRKKTLRNLRFGPLFSEGFLFIRLCDALPIPSLDLYILTLKWTNFTFRRPFSKLK